MNKHKHYQTIRAFADGWEVEFFKENVYGWERVNDPSFLPTRQYRIVPDAEGWLPWYGGEECPVPTNTVIETRHRSNQLAEVKAPQKMRWTHEQLVGDIIAYRVMQEAPKPKIKMWQWVLQSGAGKVFTTTNFYTSSTDIGEIYCDCKVIQRADWTEIEVEE